MTSPRSLQDVQRSSLAFMRRGSDRIPIVARPQCKTCSSIRRRAIEVLLISGLSPRRALDRVPDDHGTSVQSVKRHFQRGHLPLDHREVVRRAEVLAEQRWEQVGRSATEHWAHEMVAAQSVQRGTYSRMMTGETVPSVADAIRAMRFVEQVHSANRAAEREERYGQHRQQALVVAMVRLLDFVAEVAGPVARNEVFRLACRHNDTGYELVDERFAAIRREVEEEDWSVAEAIRRAGRASSAA